MYKALDSLHKKILKSTLTEEVTEQEILGLVDAIEKNTPKKVVGLYQNICPRCSDIVGYTSTYCGSCGQKLDR